MNPEPARERIVWPAHHGGIIVKVREKISSETVLQRTPPLSSQEQVMVLSRKRSIETILVQLLLLWIPTAIVPGYPAEKVGVRWMAKMTPDVKIWHA